MPKFVLTYHGMPDIKSKEEGANQMAAWKGWMASLGDAAVNPGVPVGASKTTTKSGVEDDGGPNPLSGFTIILADTMDPAIKLAQDCPHISGNGTIEIAQAIDM